MGPWDTSALDTLHQWDPAWSKAVETMTANPWTGSLDRKTVELICVAINAACTSLNPRRIQDIKAALKLGATVDEIMDVFNLCVAQGITACNMGIPILDEKLAEHPAR
jgi:alkylhydroperoxidase/carboxymuconolactone decarboxylase family protein YurZ